MDYLLECLVILTKINHHPFSQESLRSGLPLENNRLTPSLFIRAAERAGYIAKIFERPLDKITNLTLPAVLILQNDQACILCKINDNATVDLMLPETGDTVCTKSIEALAGEYTGYVIYVRPVVKFESRSELAPEQHAPDMWFWDTLWQYRYIYLQVGIAAFLINVFNLVNPLFVMNVYDRVVPNFAESTLWVLVSGVLIIFTFDFILRNLRSYLIDISGKKADIIMASNLFQQVLGMEMVNKPESVGAFVGNLREFEVLRDFFTSATLATLIDIPFVLLFFILTWYLGGVVVLVPITIVPIVLWLAYMLEKPLRKNVVQAMQGAMQKHAMLVETMTGLETIKCLSAEGQLQKKWENHVGTTSTLELNSRFISGLVINITNFSQQLVTVGIVALGVYCIHSGTLTMGGLIACSILSGRILAPLSQMANLLTRFQQAKMALASLNKLMSMPIERPLKKHFLHLPELKGDIEFDNVSFQYPGQQTLALDKVSFKIKAGERACLIGRIGSGKSTIQKLLLRLYAPLSGSIRIDGIDISQIDPVDLRRHIGYVPQESLLFFGSVRSNIAMSQPDADDSQIIAAARLAGVDKFIHHHPNGYAMPVGERGEGLSGGQRQAVSIARSLLANPAIWLFDEPTSAMDNSSEFELINNLASHLQQKTILLVTHRTTLFPLVDRLMVMDNGRLVMDGAKEKILAALTKSQEAPRVNRGEVNDQQATIISQS